MFARRAGHSDVTGLRNRSPPPEKTNATEQKEAESGRDKGGERYMLVFSPICSEVVVASGVSGGGAYYRETWTMTRFIHGKKAGHRAWTAQVACAFEHRRSRSRSLSRDPGRVAETGRGLGMGGFAGQGTDRGYTKGRDGVKQGWMVGGG